MLQPASKTQTDPVQRKREVYLLVRQLKAGFLQVAWCGLVYRLYGYAEASRQPWIKRLVAGGNLLLRVLTGGRINSS